MSFWEMSLNKKSLDEFSLERKNLVSTVAQRYQQKDPKEFECDWIGNFRAKDF